MLLMFAQLFERNLHLKTKGIGIKLGGLCLGVHGTWRTGGAGARVGAAGFVSRRKEPVGFPERLTSAHGSARDRRVCSFRGVGYLGLFGLR